MSSEVLPLSAVGPRVRVDTVVPGDVPSYRRAVQQSVDRIRPWNPVNAGDLQFHLERQSDAHRTFIIRALPDERLGGHDIVGKVNLTSITRGRALSGMLGYDSYDPYAGKGLFAEGLRLVVDLAFTSSPRGLALNRVEAAVQPGNVRSAGLLRSLGFRRRGEYPSYLWLGDGSGRDAWRDHVVYGIARADWPARPYAPHTHDGPVVLVVVAGDPTRAEVAGARALAVEMGVPVLRESGDLSERLMDAVTGAVVIARDGGSVPAHVVVRPHELSGPAEITRIALAARALAHV